MKKLQKILAIILVIVISISSLAVTSFAATGSSKDRYSVLVLDVSGSMSGTPVAELKEGATAFCEQILNNNRNNNKIAIVTFASSAYLKCDFTSDLDTLTSTINSLSASGGTDLAGGLSKAKQSLDAVEGDVIKNMVVMCDGEPNSTSAAYNVIKSIPLHWNVYGLYYCPYGAYSSAATVMKNVGRNGYYEVTDGSALAFSFVDNGTTITTESVNNVVVRVACPVDVAVTLNGVTLDKNNPKTTFGELNFEGEENEIKVLTLAYRDDYVIDITGTGEGTMKYDIAYYCNGDELYNLSYPEVEITPETKITTGVNVDESSMTLDVDGDGDGEVDEQVSPEASATSFWYQIQLFFENLIYKIKEFFASLLG